jgi:16S rRNA (uracil1498-N3)-methyltransferase
VVFDGSGHDYDGEVTDLGRDAVTVRVGAGRPVASESPLAITLFQGVCRGPRMDTVIQKATELGVSRIQPVLSSRSVVRVDETGAERKQEHWQRVAIAAAEQSARSCVPDVLAPRRLDEVVPAIAGFATSMLLDPGGSPLAELGRPGSPLALLVGPEGGLDDDERRLATDFGFMAVRLGPRILRTETAPLAALAVIQFLAGDLA